MPYSLPDRQLRKRYQQRCYGDLHSLPHRQLRNFRVSSHDSTHHSGIACLFGHGVAFLVGHFLKHFMALSETPRLFWSYRGVNSV